VIKKDLLNCKFMSYNHFLNIPVWIFYVKQFFLGFSSKVYVHFFMGPSYCFTLCTFSITTGVPAFFLQSQHLHLPDRIFAGCMVGLFACKVVFPHFFPPVFCLLSLLMFLKMLYAVNFYCRYCFTGF